MTRPYPWKCRSCGENRVNPKVMDYPAEMEHDGRSYSFIVPGIEILECDACHNRVLPSAAFAAVMDKLRIEAGLLTPTEIREKRKSLSLTQEQLASDLKIAKETVSRWETGGQIQQRAMDLLLRLYFDVPEVREHLKQSQGAPSSAIAAKLRHRSDDTPVVVDSSLGRYLVVNSTPLEIEQIGSNGVEYDATKGISRITQLPAVGGIRTSQAKG
jgi:putative zinc finger/helix-turn-helix YgiT family protein